MEALEGSEVNGDIIRTPRQRLRLYPGLNPTTLVLDQNISLPLKLDFDFDLASPDVTDETTQTSHGRLFTFR